MFTFDISLVRFAHSFDIDVNTRSNNTNCKNNSFHISARPCIILYLFCARNRSKDGVVVRALASHQCVPGSNPEPGVIRGLSLLLVLALTPRFSSGSSGFPPSTKFNIFKFQFDRESERTTVINLVLSSELLL